MSVLPFGGNGQYLLYHVRRAVIAQSNEPLLDRGWLDPHTPPFASVDWDQWFDLHLESCCTCVPALRAARLKGVVQGKVNHCTWVADEVARQLGIVAG